MTTVTTPVPQITRLVTIEQEIAALRAQQADLLTSIRSDLEFMDVPILELTYFDGAYPNPGDRVHVILHEQEATGRTYHRGHLAAECDDWMCALTERTKFPKYAHVGRRNWATPQPDHVVIGVERVVDDSMWASEMTQYVLAPVNQTRTLRRPISVDEHLMEVDGL